MPVEGVLKFPLKIKNYNDLRDTTSAVARVLFVVCVPRSWDERMLWSPTELRLLRCGYWAHLAGEPEKSNLATVTVALRDELSVEALNFIMFKAAQGEL